MREIIDVDKVAMIEEGEWTPLEEQTIKWGKYEFKPSSLKFKGDPSSKYARIRITPNEMSCLLSLSFNPDRKQAKELGEMLIRWAETAEATRAVDPTSQPQNTLPPGVLSL